MLRIKDPGGIFLRRALRVAVVIPLTYFFVQDVLHLESGSGIASFTSYALLGLADFGGPPRSRALAYIVTGLVGLPLVIIGSLLSAFLLVSIVAAGLVAFAVNYSGVLRGYFAAAGVTLLLPFVMAVTSPPGTQLMVQLCVGYVIGVVASLIGAMVLWPTYLGSTLRQSAATALQAAANETALRWLDGGTSDRILAAREATATAVANVHTLYDGALVRPGPGTSRDRSLVAVLSELDRLNRVLQWRVDEGAATTEVNADLARTTVAALHDSATALLGSKGLPDPAAVNAARESHELRIESLVEQHPATERSGVTKQMADLMPLRIVAMSAQSIAGNVAGAVGDHLPEGAAAVTLGGQQLWDPVERLGPSHYLLSQFKWKSPWVRNAIRTGTAIALATAIVQVTDIPHGMWIVLGTLVALRFDAGGTSRTAVTVLVGTVIGFLLATVVVTLVGTNDTALWIMFPFAVFLASYTPNSISLAVGQVCFTVYGVILYALYLPTGYTTAEYRLFNVFLAMVVSLLVSALLWPRGVVTLVHTTLRSAAVTTGSYLVDAMSVLTKTDRRADENVAASLADEQVASRRALTLAKQTYDLAYVQKGPGVPDLRDWSSAAEAISNVEWAAEIVSSVVRHGRTSGGDQVTRDALVNASESIERVLETFPEADVDELDRSVETMKIAVTDYTSAPEGSVDPKDFTALVWVSEWLQYAAWELNTNQQARSERLVTS